MRAAAAEKRRPSVMPPRPRRQDRANDEDRQRCAAIGREDSDADPGETQSLFLEKRCTQCDVPQGWSSHARGRAACSGGPEPRRMRERRWRAAPFETVLGSAPGEQGQQRNRIAGYNREDERAPRRWPRVRATSRHSGGACNSAMRRFDRKRRREATLPAAVVICLVVDV